jgi:uncharacterized protein
MTPIPRRTTRRLRRRRRLAPLWMALLALVVGRPAAAQNPKDLHYQGYVNDFARVISPDTKESLTAICQELDKKANAQIAIVTVRSLEHETIEEFSIDLATRWGIGPKQKDRGVLILVAPRQHRYRIEVGYGLEPILPDGLVGDFGREALPQLRIGNYSGAILLLTERVAGVIAKDRGVTLDALAQQGQAPMGTETAPPPLTPRAVAVPILSLLVLLFFPLLGLLLRMRAGRRYGHRHGVMWAAAPWFLGGGGFGGGGGAWGGGGFGGGGGAEGAGEREEMSVGHGG